MDDFISEIYEAAFVTDQWPYVLKRLGDIHNTKGALLFAFHGADAAWVGGGDIKPLFEVFLAEGWAKYNERAPRLMASGRTDFVTDLDLMTLDEINANPMYTEYLIPNGVFAGAGTRIVGLEQDNVILSLEGFSSFDAAKAACPELNRLRPHLARAAIIASQMKLERARAMAQALEAIRVPAAVVSAKGVLRAVNRLLEPLIGSLIFDSGTGLGLADALAGKRLKSALRQVEASPSQAQSIPLTACPDGVPRVMHIIPIVGQGRDLFQNNSVLLTVAGPDKRRSLGEPLLQTLFDLTPAEARVMKAIAEGASVKGLAAQLGLSAFTIRDQLSAAMHKTNTGSQGALIDLYGALSR